MEAYVGKSVFGGVAIGQFQGFYEKALKEVGEANAALISDELAAEVNFFSIGTNDLTQYTLTIDRQNTKLDEFYDAHHPAILKLIRMVVENAHKAGIWAGICGELGADQSLTREFLEMGMDELSVSPGSILPIRKIVLETNVQEYRAGKNRC